MSKDLIQRNSQWIGSVAGSLGLFVILTIILIRVNWPVFSTTVPEDSIAVLGDELINIYVVPFEVASVLLLIALIGSFIIAREKE